jgi:hypothetical protein
MKSIFPFRDQLLPTAVADAVVLKVHFSTMNGGIMPLNHSKHFVIRESDRVQHMLSSHANAGRNELAFACEEN